MSTTECTPECKEREAKYKVGLAEFEAKHPNYCRSCGATGVVTYQENQSPLGSGQVWLETLYDCCDDCSGQGKCPLCGQMTLDEDTYETCSNPACTYDYSNPEMPPQFECNCYYEQQERDEVTLEEVKRFFREWREIGGGL